MTVVKQKVNTFYLWLIWLIGAGFFFYKYLVQVSPSVMTNELMQEFHLHATGLGNLSAFYFYAYLMMQIPVGILLDKYSPRLLTAMAILLCAVSTLTFSQTHDVWLACVSRALMGTGAAFAAVSCFKLATVWFPAKRFALVSGLYMTAAMLGAVGGQAPLSLLVQGLGWRTALEAIGGMGIVLAIVYYAIVRDKSNAIAPIRPQHEKPFKQFFSVLKNKQAWLLSLYSGMAFAPVTAFGGLWGVPFLERVHQLTSTQAALAVSWVFIGFAVGAPLFGWFSDFIGRRKPILFLSTLLSLMCLLWVIYFPSPNLFSISLLLFFFGFGTSGFFTSFAMIREVFPMALAATVLGFMNTFDSICEALSEPLVGVILDATWDGKTVGQLHQFSTQSYHVALLILPAYIILSILTLFFIKETYCQSVSEE